MPRTLFLALLFIHSAANAIPFFELKKDGRTSYLLGTHHGVPGEILPAGILLKLLNSRNVFVETEATEESILNALTAAETITGYKGHTAHALPLDELQRLMAKYQK